MRKNSIRSSSEKWFYWTRMTFKNSLTLDLNLPYSCSKLLLFWICNVIYYCQTREEIVSFSTRARNLTYVHKKTFLSCWTQHFFNKIINLLRIFRIFLCETTFNGNHATLQFFSLQKNQLSSLFCQKKVAPSGHVVENSYLRNQLWKVRYWLTNRNTFENEWQWVLQIKWVKQYDVS
jgi:hypothetical protein